MYAIDKVVRWWIWQEEEALGLQLSHTKSDPEKKEETDVSVDQTRMTCKRLISYDEWVIWKKLENQLKSKLVNNVKSEIKKKVIDKQVSERAKRRSWEKSVDKWMKEKARLTSKKKKEKRAKSKREEFHKLMKDK